MKSIKILSLPAVAAAVAMAFVGASSAMAGNTALCKADQNPCAKANLVTHLHALTAAGNKAVILNNILNVECDLLYLSSSVGKLGAPQVIQGNFTYSNCEGACEVEEVSETSTFKLLRTCHETANLALTGEMFVNCAFGLECILASEEMRGLAKGALLPFTGEEEIFEQDELIPVGGFFCPEEAKLDFLILSLDSVYIST